MGTPEELLQSQARVMQELASGKLTLNLKQAEQIFLMVKNARKLARDLWVGNRVRNLEQLLGRLEPDKAA